MIVDLPDTSTAELNHRLVRIRDDGGAVALGRVLTLVVVTDDPATEPAIEAANQASQEHPCRILVVVRAGDRGPTRLDGQIRVGGDAGASDVIVLRPSGPLTAHPEALIMPLLLPDVPVVAWWAGPPPDAPAHEPIGLLAQRRITDVATTPAPVRALTGLITSHTPGDTDLAWARITGWRAVLAAALDQPPFEPVTSATVTGSRSSAGAALLAGWLASRLACPVEQVVGSGATDPDAGDNPGPTSVRLDRRSGPVELVRADASTGHLDQPGQPRRRVALPPRDLADCLAEELRRLDDDEVYDETLTRGLGLLG
ncbi:MAG: glucose-6-phosphate dehydrogenase assembly protein OpcA [Acidimicrobiales bacterium]